MSNETKNTCCSDGRYVSIQQAYKKEPGEDKRKPVSFTTPIQAVYDGKTGASLEAILAQFNSVYVQYQGSPKDTRNIIPEVMRRAGLTITYMDMESNTITERASSAVQKDNDHWGLDVNWSRVDELSLSGEISVSANGTWVINGEDTGVKALGPKGDTGLTPWLKTIDNKLHFSYDNVTWEPCSENIAAWFRFSATSSDSQAGTIGRIQISRDNKTWTDLSPEFRNYLRIQGYVATTSALPANQVVGTIYGVGPTYATDDTDQTNPIYRLHVWNGSSWVDNGQFTSIAAGVVQETGDSETEVMSQKAVTEKLSELGSEDVYIKKVSKDLTQGVELAIEVPMKISKGDVVWCRFATDGSINQGIANFLIDGANVGTAYLDKDNYFTASSDGLKVGIQRSGGGITGSGNLVMQVGILRADIFTRKDFKEYEESTKTEYKSIVQTIVGTTYINRIQVAIKKGERFAIGIEGGEGLLSYDLIGNIYVTYDNNERVSIDGSISSIEFIKGYIAESNIISVEIQRGASGVVEVGDITLSVYTSQAAINSYVEQEIKSINKTIEKKQSVSNHSVAAGVNLSITKTVNYNKGERIFINLYGDDVLSLGAYNLYVGSLHITAYIGIPQYITLPNNVSAIHIARGASGVVSSGNLTLEIWEIPSYVSLSQNGTMFISANGNDDNDGSESSPKLTVNSCLKEGASKIVCAGGVYEQTINLSLSTSKEIKLIGGDANNRTIFKHPNSGLASSAVGVDGYNKVRKCQVSDSFTIATSNLWLYQDGVADAATRIEDSERHPAQRGLMYRCYDATKIIKCAATSLTDALNEIESASDYKWYYDSSEKAIYLSCPTEISNGNKIRVPSGNFITGNDESISFEAVGIDVRYMAFNLNKLRVARLTDCSAMYVWGGGAIPWDNGIVELIRCEAARCIASEATGDGFNAHADKIGESVAKTCCASLIDCWSHDNNDDGYSDHERAECVIRGGLFEYNGKGGVTPSYGSHCSCFNVMSRKNYNGFYYVGDVADDEGGQGGQLICYNCIAEGNRKGGSMFGFAINGNGNRAILIQCISKNNGTAYYAADGTAMELNDCRALNCEKIKDGGGSISVANSEIVT